MHTKVEVSAFTHSKDIMVPPKFENRSRKPSHCTGELFYILRLTLDIAYLCTEFDGSSFSRSRDRLESMGGLSSLGLDLPGRSTYVPYLKSLSPPFMKI